jgi:hypothetical protein
MVLGPKASYMNLRESIPGPCGLEICVTRGQKFLERRYRYPSISTVDLLPAEHAVVRIERLLKGNHTGQQAADRRTNDH